MQPAHRSASAESLAHGTRSILYVDWRHRIQTATELDQLVAAVKAYLAEWQPAELGMLPAEFGDTVLRASDEIAYRAVVVAQAELKAAHDSPSAYFLREMSLTLMAAASRLRFLTALRARESGR